MPSRTPNLTGRCVVPPYVKPSLLRKKAFSLKPTGSRRAGGIAYRWTTVFKLKRVR